MQMLSDAVAALTGIVIMLPIILLSILAFWRQYSVLFMICAGLAMVAGAYMPDILNAGVTDELSISAAISLWLYSLVCIAFAYKTIFFPERNDGGY